MYTKCASCFFILCTMLPLTGCIESEHSLSDTNDAFLMPELIGVWRETSIEGGASWTVSAAGKGFPEGMYQLIENNGDKDDREYFFLTAIGDDRYINVAHFKSDSPPNTWDLKQVTHFTLMCFRFENNQVTLNAFSENAVDAAKTSGKLTFRTITSHETETLDSDLESELELELELDFELDPDTELDIQKEQLSNSTQELRAFLASHSDVIRGTEIIKVTKQ